MPWPLSTIMSAAAATMSFGVLAIATPTCMQQQEQQQAAAAAQGIHTAGGVSCVLLNCADVLVASVLSAARPLCNPSVEHTTAAAAAADGKAAPSRQHVGVVQTHTDVRSRPSPMCLRPSSTHTQCPRGSSSSSRLGTPPPCVAPDNKRNAPDNKRKNPPVLLPVLERR